MSETIWIWRLTQTDNRGKVPRPAGEIGYELHDGDEAALRDKGFPVSSYAVHDSGLPGPITSDMRADPNDWRLILTGPCTEAEEIAQAERRNPLLAKLIAKGREELAEAKAERDALKAAGVQLNQKVSGLEQRIAALEALAVQRGWLPAPGGSA